MERHRCLGCTSTIDPSARGNQRWFCSDVCRRLVHRQRRTNIGHGKGHQAARIPSNVWLTPPEILAALGPFDLDPCASPEPRPWPTARRHICVPDDGLAAQWQGRVWLNPPYGREAVKWVARLADHGTGTALVFARTEARWFVEHVWKRATLLMFLTGRIHFHHPDGTRSGDNGGAPSVLVAYGTEDANRLRNCTLNGALAAPASRRDSRVSELQDVFSGEVETFNGGCRPACACVGGLGYCDRDS